MSDPKPPYAWRRGDLSHHHEMVAQTRFDGELERIRFGLTQNHRVRWFDNRHVLLLSVL